MGKWLATPMSRSVIKIRHPPVHACAKHLTGPIPTFLLEPNARFVALYSFARLPSPASIVLSLARSFIANRKRIEAVCAAANPSCDPTAPRRCE
jgi:hypothetical protein